MIGKGFAFELNGSALRPAALAVSALALRVAEPFCSGAERWFVGHKLTVMSQNLFYHGISFQILC